MRFPAQKQFLEKLVVQAFPCRSIPSFLKTGVIDPKVFEGFSTAESVGGRIESPEDPRKGTSVTFKALNEGEPYIFRLVCTNPTGTSYGQPTTTPTYTLPPTPAAPTFGYASVKTINIKFPPCGSSLRQISKLGIEMAVWCADPFGPENKKKGLLEDKDANIAVRTTGLIRSLKAGTSYVFRLVVTNSSGSVTGPASKPMKTLPKAPNPPREEVTGRTDKEVSLKFDKCGHEISKLTLQYAILKGRSTFEDLKKNGGKEVTLANPQEVCAYVVKGLKPDTNYVFRLIAHNSSGKSTGQILGPIKTITFTPEMLDKSGWLYELPGGNSKVTLGRRLSLKKTETPKYWYTIDGKLLSWSATIDGPEINFLHLGKVAQVAESGNTLEITLKKPEGKKKEPKKLALMGESDDPNVSSEDLIKSWVKAIQEAIVGRPEVKEIVNEEPVVDEEDGGDFGLVEDEDGEGFGDDFDEEEDGGGFGGDVDEEDGEGFGDFDEEDEEATGFG